MSIKGKMWVVVLSGVIALYAVIGGLPSVGGLLQTNAQQTTNDPNAQMKIMESVLQHIQNDYVDIPDMDKVRIGALRGLASGLDPYSSYLTPDQAKDYQSGKGNNNKVGIGAEFSQISGYLYVIAVSKGSPADKAGIRSGDVIEYIDTKASRDVSLYDAKQLVAGDSGTEVSLRVLRAGEKPQTIKVTRGPFKTPVAEIKMDANKTGILKINSLAAGESADVREQLQSLIKQGAQKVVIDLRGVAGGDLNEGIAVANLFIKNGQLAQVIGRENKVLKTFTADPSKTIFDGNAAVVIDLSSSAASEIIASAFLDNKRGDVVGERSFGAGIEQDFFPLSSGGGYLLTVAKWASGNGVPFLGEERSTMGVKPSIEVKKPDNPEPVAPEDLVEQQDPSNPSPSATPDNSKPKTPATVEDLQLKRAIEAVNGIATKAKA